MGFFQSSKSFSSLPSWVVAGGDGSIATALVQPLRGRGVSKSHRPGSLPRGHP